MSNMLSDPTSIKIMTESNLSDIISRFDDDVILDIINENINFRFNAVNELSNLPAACELTFKNEISNLDDCAPYLEQIKILRDSTYRSIINIVCNKFDFTFHDIEEVTDIYTAAYSLYNLIISNFRNAISDFYANYIMSEYKGLYEAFGIARFKKQKDSATIYNKSNYDNQELGLIISNLNFVLENMRGIDFSFDTILNYMYKNNSSVSNYIRQNFTCNCDFYKNIILPILYSEYKSILITDIRFKIDSVGLIPVGNILDMQHSSEIDEE